MNSRTGQASCLAPILSRAAAVLVSVPIVSLGPWFPSALERIAGAMQIAPIGFFAWCICPMIRATSLLRVQGAVGLLHGEVTEILGSAKPARENEGIQLRSLGCGHVADLPAGDSGRLDQDIPALAGAHPAIEVVPHVQLFDVGGKADNLRSSAVKRDKREHGLVDFGPVIDSTA